VVLEAKVEDLAEEEVVKERPFRSKRDGLRCHL